MSKIRVNKTKNYSVISNYHFKDKRLSLKAKGLLSQMLSLPDNWNYTIAGLVAINKENESAIKSALEELKNNDYLVITKLMPNETETGRIEYVYDIYETPKQEGKKQGVENLGVEFLGVENQGQLNIYNKDTNNKINNNIKSVKRMIFKKPTIEEVELYCKERNNNVDAQRFIDFYEANNWTDSKGNKVKSWKQKIITWESHQNNNIKDQEKLPDWWDKTNKDFEEEMTEDERREFEAIKNGTYRA